MEDSKASSPRAWAHRVRRSPEQRKRGGPLDKFQRTNSFRSNKQRKVPKLNATFTFGENRKQFFLSSSEEEDDDSDSEKNDNTTSLMGRKTPRTLRSLLRNFMTDSGELRDDIDIPKYASEANADVTNMLVQEVAEMHPKLRRLVLTDCVEVTDVGLWAIARQCVELRSLDISGLCQITQIGLRSVSLRCTNLREIDMSRNDRLDDVALRALAAGCPNLHVIKLNRCIKVADAGVIDLASNCKRLEVIDLSNCPKVCEFGDHPLLKISQCKYLRELNLLGCPQIRGIGLEAVTRGCPHLSTLRVSRCVAGIRDDQAARALMNHCSRLETLVLIDWTVSSFSQVLSLFTHMFTQNIQYSTRRY